MHLEKFQVDKIQNGRLSPIIHLDRPDIVEYHENRSRYLHHYYKTNCKVSGEDAFWKNSTRPSLKWPLIGQYSFSHGRYLVNLARWLVYSYSSSYSFETGIADTICSFNRRKCFYLWKMDASHLKLIYWKTSTTKYFINFADVLFALKLA